MTNLRSHLGEIVGSTLSSGGAVTAIATWQLQVAWSVTVSAGLIGIISGVLTIRSLLKRDQRRRVKDE
jgi:ABC-type iron transport system FetAB permease component